MQSLRSLAVMCCLIVSAAVVGAQTPKINNVKTRTDNCPQLEVEFDLMSPSGSMVTSLSARDVAVVEDGQSVTGELSSGAPPDGVAYVIVVDTSGSMRKLLPEVREALASFAEKLENRDRVVLVTVNDDVELVRRFSDDRTSLVESLRSLENAGTSTELYFGVHEGLEQFTQVGLPSRKVAIVISDGMDEGTAYSIDDCINKAHEFDANILGIGIESGNSGALLNIRRMAEMTGGLFLRFEANEDWSAKLSSIREHIDGRWIFRWNTTFPGDGSVHEARLEVGVEGIRIGEDLELKLPVVRDLEAERRQRNLVIGIAAGVALLVIAAILLLLRRSKKKAREQARLHEERRRQKADQQSILDRRLEDVNRKLDELAEPEESETPPIDATGPSAVAQSSKRKTVFVSGDGPQLNRYSGGALEVLDGPLAGSRLTLLSGRTAIGREDDNNIVLDDERVSRHHAAVDFEGGVFWLKDLSSANGTVVDEQLKVTTRHPMAHGQTIRIGGVLFRFHGEP